MDIANLGRHGGGQPFEPDEFSDRVFKGVRELKNAGLIIFQPELRGNIAEEISQFS